MFSDKELDEIDEIDLTASQRDRLKEKRVEHDNDVQVRRLCLEIIEAMEWVCESTWEDPFRNRKLSEDRIAWGLPRRVKDEQGHPQRMTPFDSSYTLKRNEERSPPGIQSGGGGNGDVKGRDPSELTASPIALSNRQRAVDDAKLGLSRAYADTRSHIAEVISFSAPLPGLLEQFFNDCVLPRVKAVLESILKAVGGGYLRTPPTDLFLREDLSMTQREMANAKSAIGNATISTKDIVRFRFGEEGTQVMYALKAVRFVGQMGGLWAARSSYNEAYVKSVFAEDAQGRGPPPLTRLLAMFLGIDASIQLVTLLVLVMIGHLILIEPPQQASSDLPLSPSPSSPMPPSSPKANTKAAARKLMRIIDDEFIQNFLAEYFVTTAAIGIFGLMFASLVRRKLFFRLQEDGARAARMYATCLACVCGVFAVVPVFMIIR